LYGGMAACDAATLDLMGVAAALAAAAVGTDSIS
jgi:hypothetical protein